MKTTYWKLSSVSLALTACWLWSAGGCKPSSTGEVGGTATPQASAPADQAPSAETAPAAAEPTAERSPAPWNLSPTAGKGAILGHVSYRGTPPKPKPINFGPEKKCHEGNTSQPTDETLVVGADGSIRWTLVHIVGNVEGEYPPPTEPVTLDQKGCIFIPHVLAVQTGQPINVLNSDEVAHNVRCEAVRNPSVNFILPTKGGSKTIQFDQADVGMKLKCDIHFWMNGFIHAMRHPFFYVTDTDGWFKIENLPPGEYKLEARQEKLGKENQQVVVKAGEVLTVDFVFSPK